MVSDLVIRDPTRRAELAARVWRSVAMPKAGAFRRCWVWTGGVTSAGDPRIQLDANRGTLVRRLVWVLYNAPPDVGLSADYYVRTRCFNTLCVRPDHLSLKKMLDLLEEERPNALAALRARAAQARVA
jgi:hypothetical protein